MAQGHGYAVLNNIDRNRVHIETDPDVRQKVFEGIVNNIFMEWADGHSIFTNPSSTDHRIKLAEQFQRSAVTAYRGAMLRGFSAQELDASIQLFIQSYKMDEDVFRGLKSAVADLTSGKYPLADLIDEKAIEKNLAELAERNLARAAKVITPVAIVSGLMAADSISNQAEASMRQSSHSLKDGNYLLGMEQFVDGGIHTLRADLKSAETAINAAPVSFITALATGPAFEKMDAFLNEHTIEGKAATINNQQSTISQCIPIYGSPS